jgi:hypothetical protein
MLVCHNSLDSRGRHRALAVCKRQVACFIGHFEPASSPAGGSLALSVQLFWLFVIAIPIASVAWTITHEEVFSEPREWCERNSKNCRTLLQRKFFYLFTCEYCFSHWVTAFFLIVTRFKLIFTDWRGYLIAGFSLVWVANVYMSFFARIRLDVKRERVEISVQEKAVGNNVSADSEKLV